MEEQKRGKKFGPIEILIVLCIIAILTIIAIPYYQRAKIRTKILEGQRLTAAETKSLNDPTWKNIFCSADEVLGEIACPLEGTTETLQRIIVYCAVGSRPVKGVFFVATNDWEVSKDWSLEMKKGVTENGTPFVNLRINTWSCFLTEQAKDVVVKRRVKLIIKP